MDVFFHGMPLKVRVRDVTDAVRAVWWVKMDSLSTRFSLIPRSGMKLKTFATMDPHLLVGLVNTELRNNASSLEDLCKTHDLSQEELVARLAGADYHFSEEAGQFR